MIRVSRLVPLLLCSLPPAALAEPRDDDWQPAFSLGAQPTFYFGEICEEDFDVSACTQGFASIGPTITALVQPMSPWQVGARGGVGFEAGSRGTATSVEGGPTTQTEFVRRVFDMQLEPRWQPSLIDGVWLGLDLGAVHVQEVATTRGDSSISDTRWAPLAGVTGGYDFLLEPPIALSVGARAAWLGFDEGAGAGPSFITYGNVYLVALLLEVKVAPLMNPADGD